VTNWPTVTPIWLALTASAWAQATIRSLLLDGSSLESPTKKSAAAPPCGRHQLQVKNNA